MNAEVLRVYWLTCFRWHWLRWFVGWRSEGIRKRTPLNFYTFKG